MNGFEGVPVSEAGTYDIAIQSVIDPCINRPFTGDPPSVLTITRLAPGAYRITGASPWVMLIGTTDEGATGAANLSGTGVVAGFSDVVCTFTGIRS